MNKILSPAKIKKIALIGATGSIGVSALDVVRRYRERFHLSALIANNNYALLAQQAREFTPDFLALSNTAAAAELRKIYRGPATIFSGDDGVVECLRTCGAEFCLSAASGLAGLLPTLTAIESKMDLGLANKESLVAAGEIILPKIAQYGVKIFPIDSEHSALQQCLSAGEKNEIAKIIITGSGGAFRDLPREKLATVTAREALAHPTWKMGAKITVDSATLVNKALEVIEAHHLFNLDYAKIEVLLHPQSIIHGAVEFNDGAIIAQMARPDMRLPILHALTFPERLNAGVEKLTLAQLANLTFTAPDLAKYPLLEIGIICGQRGGLYPTAFSAANEAAVQLFLANKINYWEIVKRIENVLAQTPNLPITLANILACDAEMRAAIHGF